MKRVGSVLACLKGHLFLKHNLVVKETAYEKESILHVSRAVNEPAPSQLASCSQPLRLIVGRGASLSIKN